MDNPAVLYVAALGSAAIMLVAGPLALAVVIAAGVAFWWMSRLDWFQRIYASTLLLMAGAVSNIAPLAAVSDYGRYLAAGMLLMVTWFSTRRTTPASNSRLQTRTIWALWLLVGTAAASILWSGVPWLSAQQLVAFSILVGLVSLLSQRRWTDRSTLVDDLSVGHTVLAFCFIASIAAGVVHYPGAKSFGGTADSVGRFQGFFNNPNALGLLAAVAIPLGWGLYLERRGFARLVLILPAIVALLMSESRSAIIAAAAALLWLLLRGRGGHIVKVGYFSLTAAAFVLATGWNPLQSSLSRFGKSEGGDVLNTRGDAWSSTLELIQQQPIGYGWGSGRSLFESLQGSANFTFAYTSVHNSYLQVLLELGILGLLPLAYLVIALVLVAVRGKIGGIESGLVGVITAGLIVQITESAIFGTGQPYPYIFWLAVAGAIALYKPWQPSAEPASAPSLKAVSS